MKSIRVIVKGRVQGVFFRRSAKAVADSLMLKGYVKNLGDSSVEIVAEGDEEKLKELLKFCRKGPVGANVTDVILDYIDSENEFKGFEIRQ
ncbi:MAG: acylphosphatase [Nanoarchaeota archaeon]